MFRIPYDPNGGFPDSAADVTRFIKIENPAGSFSYLQHCFHTTLTFEFAVILCSPKMDRELSDFKYAFRRSDPNPIRLDRLICGDEMQIPTPQGIKCDEFLLYTVADGTTVAVLKNKLPIFDSGDSMYNRYETLAFYADGKETSAIGFSYGWYVGHTNVYHRLTGADANTLAALRAVGLPVDGVREIEAD